MLGYSKELSAHELWEHHRKLKEKHGPERTKELDWAYEWIKDRSFMKAIDASTKESWLWLKTAMLHPPHKVIDQFADACQSLPPMQSHIVPLHPLQKPCCSICDEPLAESINEKIKFCTMLCNCGEKLVHPSCAEAYVDQCYLCRQYFIQTPLLATVRSTLGRFAGQTQTLHDTLSLTGSSGTKMK